MLLTFGLKDSGRDNELVVLTGLSQGGVSLYFETVLNTKLCYDR